MTLKYTKKIADRIDGSTSMLHNDAWFERPGIVLILLAGGVFISELVIMAVILQMPVFATFNEHLLDSTVLTLAVLPGLYLLVLRPQKKLNRQRLLLSKALQTSLENFETIVAKSVDGTLVLDHKGVIQYVNFAAEQLLQQNSQNLLGEMFGFPAIAGQVTEIDIVRMNHRAGTAEMRMMQTDWHGEPAMLVSLRDISDIVHLREELREQSLTDELSGLNNRRGFLLLAEQQIKLVTRTKAEMFVIFIDLDRFKQINDTLGHEVGDEAVIDTANILSQTFRGSDIVARYGGDEFVVLTIDTNGLGLDAIITRLQKAITDHNQTAERPYQILISFGVARYNVDHPTPLADVIERADQRMYEQKQAKKTGDAKVLT